MTEPQAWSPWAVAAWAVILGALFVFEMVALRRPDDAIPPLTQVFRRWVPGVATVSFTVWLLWHAIDTYT